MRDINELLQMAQRSSAAQAAADSGGGAAAAAGVLTAIDEDGEGDAEPPAPRDFDYYTDSEDAD
jgi:26S proteasome regulatory subunit N2